MKICIYVDEHTSWKEKIEKRALIGKNLTPAQQAKYDAWLCRCEPRLVFSKARRCLVRDAKQVKADCIAIQLRLSDDPEKLQVLTTSGDVYRLVLLNGFKKVSPNCLKDRISSQCLYTHIHGIHT